MKYNHIRSQEKTMIPKLLASNNPEEIQKYIDLEVEKFSISKFDVTLVNQENSSIKIEQIRELKQKLSLKPFQGKIKASIIYNAQNLTIEAQNACLKVLEEPPENTVILLCTPNENLLLPTIVSRCEIVRIQNANLKMQNDNAKLKITDIRINPLEIRINQIQQMDIGERFTLAEYITKKENKDEILEDVRKRAEKYVKNLTENYMRSGEVINKNNLITLQQTLKNIKSNLNIRLLLENCFINLC